MNFANNITQRVVDAPSGALMTISLNSLNIPRYEDSEVDGFIRDVAETTQATIMYYAREDLAFSGTTGELAWRVYTALRTPIKRNKDLREAALLAFKGASLFSSNEEKRDKDGKDYITVLKEKKSMNVKDKSLLSEDEIWVDTDGYMAGFGRVQGQKKERVLFVKNTNKPGHYSPLEVFKALYWTPRSKFFSVDAYDDLMFGAMAPGIQSVLKNLKRLTLNAPHVIAGLEGASPSSFLRYLLSATLIKTMSQRHELPADMFGELVLVELYYNEKSETGLMWAFGDSHVDGEIRRARYALIKKLTMNDMWLLFGPPLHLLYPMVYRTIHTLPSVLRYLDGGAPVSTATLIKTQQRVYRPAHELAAYLSRGNKTLEDSFKMISI